MTKKEARITQSQRTLRRGKQGSRHSAKRFFTFGTVGASGVIVNLAIFTVAKRILDGIYGASGATLLASSLLGDELSILFNFFLNDAWTFKNAKRKDALARRLVLFHAVTIGSVIINNIILFMLHSLAGVDAILAKLAGILVGFIWNYTMNMRFTWREYRG